MSPNQALLTLHADYIGGQNTDYRKLYFAAQPDPDDVVGQVQTLVSDGSVPHNLISAIRRVQLSSPSTPLPNDGGLLWTT